MLKQEPAHAHPIPVLIPRLGLKEVCFPNDETPYWKITYTDGTIIQATGNVIVWEENKQCPK